MDGAALAFGCAGRVAAGGSGRCGEAALSVAGRACSGAAFCCTGVDPDAGCATTGDDPLAMGDGGTTALAPNAASSSSIGSLVAVGSSSALSPLNSFVKIPIRGSDFPR